MNLCELERKIILRVKRQIGQVCGLTDIATET